MKATRSSDSYIPFTSCLGEFELMIPFTIWMLLQMQLVSRSR